MTESGSRHGGSIAYGVFAVVAGLAALGLVMLIGLLLYQSVINLEAGDAGLSAAAMALVSDVSRWFDAIFFQYNLMLLTIAVAIPPLITGFYVVGMRDEKRRRLYQEIPRELAGRAGYDIEARVGEMFRYRRYLGSMSMLVVIVLLGSMIILLLKPLPLDGSGTGVDYRKGANFLLLGPYMEAFVTGDVQAYLSNLMRSLTAFQFGFLGAYVYFITHLMRSYFTLDLTPNTFVASSVRMMMGSLLALVCAFLFTEQKQYLIPILGFAIGFFPQRGLLLIEKAGNAALHSRTGDRLFGGQRYDSPALSRLPGMSYAHEVRLQREGYDNVDNFALADPLELAIRTGFGYRQLTRWVSQACLMQHLGEDYEAFVRATGLSSLEELGAFLRNWQARCPGQDPREELSAALGQELGHKIRILCALECDNGCSASVQDPAP